MYLHVLTFAWPLDPFKTQTFFTFLLVLCWTAVIQVVRYYIFYEILSCDIGIGLHYHWPAYLVVFHDLQYQGYIWDTWRQRLLFNFESLLFSMFVLAILKVQSSSHYIPPANRYKGYPENSVLIDTFMFIPHILCCCVSATPVFLLLT